MLRSPVVKVVELLPSRVVFFHVTDSYHPEEEVHKVAEKFARPKGLWNDPLHHIVYGFDNPLRRNSTDTHGREFWITIPDNYDIPEDIHVKDFTGGLYAMLRIKNLEYMNDGWKILLDWVNKSQKYENGNHQHLEGSIDPSQENDAEIVLELYLPIRIKE